MKLLQRLRSMGQGVEPSPAAPPAEALGGLERDDFLDPPTGDAFEPVLGRYPGSAESAARDTPRR